MSPAVTSRAKKIEQGKALRKQTPRAAHGLVVGPFQRDANAILEQQNARRLPSLVGLRRELMSADPFAYLRGAAAVMAHDLQYQAMAGIPVQACGDCHLMNFGAFVSPEDNILFDINDFDETLPGVDFTVDLKRLAVSFVVAGEALGTSKSTRHDIAGAAVRAYRKRIALLSQKSPLEVWHSRIDLEQEAENFADADLRRKLTAITAAARGAGLDRDDNFPKLAKGDGIVDKPPRLFHFKPDSEAGRAFDPKIGFERYGAALPPERRVLLERYALKDCVFKAVGVGSVGTCCYVGLFQNGDGAPLFLQVKEAGPSVLEALAPAFAGHQGQRVVEGQRMMQAASDIFLGWTEHDPAERHYYVRVLKNRRLGSVSEIAEAEGLSDYARLCGRTLARAHARSADPALLAGYMGDSGAFDEAIADFALAYAKRNAIDHAALIKS
ncbi:uncharacterized protein (DUF2252 family) [Rhodoblastus acidophilus]|uniref:DUF2252 domain-containing protein n=1 Tax=Rhodoblastus acidophilus TaxID=1074 RepID=UPI00222584C5|nr:DUF2252 domain-containing protein [Rhodoblastus acidophilus]MCW2283965.1 uncharacterized protein (DUF2252 family) [Rhodoblastus acidophilus]MCW2332661.1 uncharacterized protein (DUF2252 family) [Rhodoblastus acidophilus]